MTALTYSAFHSTPSAGAVAISTSNTDILLIKDVAAYLKGTEKTNDWLTAAKEIQAAASVARVHVARKAVK